MNRNTRDEPADEYDALGDPLQVMKEVLGLVEDLRQATHKLGDAIVAGGLGAREWRSPDARLALLSDQFPDITVDELITRLSEFSGLGPDWLHGREEEIAHFNAEVEILYGVMRPLRVHAQRLRLLPMRQRSNWPLERALGDVRAGTPLDLLLGALRDLESLAPYLVPLSAEAWQAQSSQSPGSSGSVSRDSPRSPRPVNPIGALETQPQASQDSQAFTRLRDFVEPRAATGGDARTSQDSQAISPFGDMGNRLLSWLRIQVQHLLLHKWLFVAVAIITLASGTLLLSMGDRFDAGKPIVPAPSPVLEAMPAQAMLTCSGKGRTLNLVLRNSGAAPLTWSIKTPAGLALAPTHGALASGQTATLQIKLTGVSAARGALTFTSNHGPLRVPYSVTCG